MSEYFTVRNRSLTLVHFFHLEIYLYNVCLDEIYRLQNSLKQAAPFL